MQNQYFTAQSGTPPSLEDLGATYEAHIDWAMDYLTGWLGFLLLLSLAVYAVRGH